MKIIAFILSVYILALNFAPCEDDVIADDHNDTIELSQHSDTEHDHSNSDLCSPFCSCQCCQVISITDYNLHSYDIMSPEIFSNKYSYSDTIVQDVSSSLLQPPQV